MRIQAQAGHSEESTSSSTQETSHAEQAKEAAGGEIAVSGKPFGPRKLSEEQKKELFEREIKNIEEMREFIKDAAHLMNRSVDLEMDSRCEADIYNAEPFEGKRSAPSRYNPTLLGGTSDCHK